MRMFLRLLRDERGATAIEYGLIAALISCVIIGALSNDGLHLKNKFQAVGNALS